MMGFATYLMESVFQMEPMENVQGKLPLETYRKLRAYMELHGIETRSDAVRKLIAKALADESVIESVRFEHQETRKEMERLAAFLAGNLHATKPLDSAETKAVIDRIAAKTKSME
ncbi:MAG: hypothetical protein KF688_01175 [Pirellulales bacterium]|nr:hypothetical protein [Pirellulales bacterium]